jgi:hypothetical protein
MRHFRIHDNGDRPFKVKEINKHIFVFNQEDNYKKDDPIFETDYEQLWVGSKSKFQQPENWAPNYRGNSLLLKIKEDEHIFIGWEIYSFKTMKGDEIETYYSDVGNNDIPYPFAIGKTHVYLMIENVAIRRDVLDMNENLYYQYYFPKKVIDRRWQLTMKTNPICMSLKEKKKVISARIKELALATTPLKRKIIQKRREISFTIAKV